MGLVSIIVPVYNCEKYIEKCLRSIMTQTCRELEIIVIDDRSTDDSGKIIDRLSDEDTRIFAVHQNNRGYRRREI